VRAGAKLQDAADDETAIRALIGQFYEAYGREDAEGVKRAWSAKVPGSSG